MPRYNLDPSTLDAVWDLMQQSLARGSAPAVLFNGTHFSTRQNMQLCSLWCMAEQTASMAMNAQFLLVSVCCAKTVLGTPDGERPS